MATVSGSGQGMERLIKAMNAVQSKSVEVGFFDTAHYKDGTPVAYVAAIQEFGSGPIPPRPFMRSSVSEKGSSWMQRLANGANQVIEGNINADQMLEAFGMSVAGDVKERIVEIDSPPLSPATLNARRTRTSDPKNTSNKPLVDTGLMLSSVESKVVSR